MSHVLLCKWWDVGRGAARWLGAVGVAGFFFPRVKEMSAKNLFPLQCPLWL